MLTPSGPSRRTRAMSGYERFSGHLPSRQIFRTRAACLTLAAHDPIDLSGFPSDTVGEFDSYAVRALKREVRVAASGRSENHAARRSTLRAAAVSTLCKVVFASPR